MRIQFYLVFMLALMSLVCRTASVRAEDRYYVTVFAYQGEPNVPRLAHTFAAFTKASGEGSSPSKWAIENRTISWLPASLSVHLFPRQPEPGRNLTLAETLNLARAQGAHVEMWGPYRVKKELFVLAGKRILQLKTGKLGFVTLDRPFRGNGASNCMHAVSDLDSTQPLLDTGTAFGNAASAMVAEYFQRYAVPSMENTNWLKERLGVQSHLVAQ